MHRDMTTWRNKSICSVSSIDHKNYFTATTKRKSKKSNHGSTDRLNLSTRKIDLHTKDRMENTNLENVIVTALQFLFWVPEFVKFFVDKEYLSEKDVFDQLFKNAKTEKLQKYEFWEEIHKTCNNLTSEQFNQIHKETCRFMLEDKFTIKAKSEAIQIIWQIF